jgi:Lysine methyltransferase
MGRKRARDGSSSSAGALDCAKHTTEQGAAAVPTGAIATLEHDTHVGETEGRDEELRAFLRSWSWKREHRPDRDRFRRPYEHVLQLTAPQEREERLCIKQARFLGAEGFASTVWDSSIVVAKYAERWPERFAGARCLDLSAGCGLVGEQIAAIGSGAIGCCCLCCALVKKGAAAKCERR